MGNVHWYFSNKKKKKRVCTACGSKVVRVTEVLGQTLIQSKKKKKQIIRYTAKNNNNSARALFSNRYVTAM